MHKRGGNYTNIRFSVTSMCLKTLQLPPVSLPLDLFIYLEKKKKKKGAESPRVGALS